MKMNHVHFKMGLSTHNNVITSMHSDFEALIIVGSHFVVLKTMRTTSVCAPSFSFHIQFNICTHFFVEHPTLDLNIC